MSSSSTWRGIGGGGQLHALVLAGGFGRRLEPLTRRLFGEAIPKQFCSFDGARSLLQQTIDRIAPLMPPSRVTVIVDRSQAGRARRQLAGFQGLRQIEQPCDRGTAAGVLLPLLDLLGRAPDATVLLCASDHGVVDEVSFRATIDAAQRAVVEDRSRVVLIGADADHANTDYGWIVRAGVLDAHEEVDAVDRFVEKPAADEAAALFASGRALWNTMVLVVKGARLLALLRERLPRLCRAMTELLRGAGSFESLRATDYSRLPSANFSADVVAAASGLFVLALPVEAGWSDLGDEARLLEWLAPRRAPRPELEPAG